MSVAKSPFGLFTLLGLVYLCVMVYLVVAGIADALLTILNAVGAFV